MPSLNVAERTGENYRRDLRNHVLSRWGEYPLSGISGPEVAIWSGQMLAAGYATATVATQVKLLSRLLTDAADAGLIAANPIHRHPRRGPRALSPLVERVWTTLERALQIAQNATAIGGAAMGLLIITAAWTGTRWGEIAGLQRPVGRCAARERVTNVARAAQDIRVDPGDQPAPAPDRPAR